MNNKIAVKLETFFKKYKQQEYKMGEILIRADDSPRGIYYLTEGTVKKYAISKNGEELVVQMYNPMSFFPMCWALNNVHDTYYYESVTFVEVWHAPSEDVLEFLKKEPELVFDILSKIYSEDENIFLRIAYLMGGSAYDKVISELVISAKRFGIRDEFNRVRLDFNEKGIIAQTGMRRETVNRILNQLKKNGTILIDKKVLIINNITFLENERQISS